MTDQPEILPGSEVEMHLRLSLADGTEALSTFGEEPIRCRLGDGTLQPGLELALYGLKAGDTQTLTLDPEQAYGLHQPELVQDMPLSDFPPDELPVEGQVLAFTTPAGDETAGLIREVDGDQVSVDFNNPLAGHEVVFEVEILAVDAGD